MQPRSFARALCALVLATTFTGALEAHAADSPHGTPAGGAAGAAAAASAAAAGDKSDKPYGDWKKLTKDAEVMKGFFTLYKKRENLYLELQPEQLDKPFLSIVSYRARHRLQLPARRTAAQRPHAAVRALRRPRAAGRAQRTLRDADGHARSTRRATCRSATRSSRRSRSRASRTPRSALLVDLAPFVVSDLTDLAERMRKARSAASRCASTTSARRSASVKDVSREHRDRGAAHVLAERPHRARASTPCRTSATSRSPCTTRSRSCPRCP